MGTKKTPKPGQKTALSKPDALRKGTLHISTSLAACTPSGTPVGNAVSLKVGSVASKGWSWVRTEVCATLLTVFDCTEAEGEEIAARWRAENPELAAAIVWTGPKEL